MQKELGKEYPSGTQRIEFLRANCDKVEDKGYLKRFTEEELQDLKEDLSENSIQINDLEIEKTQTMSAFKDSLKPLRERKKAILINLKQKAVFTTEQCFKMIDHEAREVGYYNADGDLIDSRQASGDELQGTIFQAVRTGTHN